MYIYFAEAMPSDVNVQCSLVLLQLVDVPARRDQIARPNRGHRGNGDDVRGVCGGDTKRRRK